MSKNTSLFISDLHLHTDQPALINHFHKFMDTRAPTAQTLYILGDLFDAWMGDDVSMPDYPSVVAKLKEYTDNGHMLYIMQGNRDFLLSSRFCDSIGAKLLPDPVMIRIGGIDTLVSHGDRYCTDDIQYQRFRKIVQHPLPQAIYYKMPTQWRLNLVDYLKSGTKEHKQKKSLEIMDVNQKSIKEAVEINNAQRMIHGHTHRPNVHTVINNNVDSSTPIERIVLGDWYIKTNGAAVGSALEVFADGSYELQPF